MKIRKLTSIFMAAAMVVMLAACGKTESGTPKDKSQQTETDKTKDSGKGGRKIAVQVGTLEQTFYTMCVTGIKEAAKEGDEVIVYSPEWDQEKQLSQVEDMITKGVDCVLMAPMDADGCLPSMDLLKQSGISLLTFDRPLNEEDYDLAVAQCLISDYDIGYNGGKALAEGLKEKNGEYKGKVVTYCYTSTLAGVDRLKGFDDAIAEYPDIERIYNCDDEWDSETATRVIENVMTSNPDMNGFWGWSSPSTTACAQVCKSAGRDDIVITTNECTKEVYDYIEEGAMYAGLDINPVGLGKTAMNTMYDALDGKDVEGIIYNDVTLITAKNLNEAVTPSYEE